MKKPPTEAGGLGHPELMMRLRWPRLCHRMVNDSLRRVRAVPAPSFVFPSAAMTDRFRAYCWTIISMMSARIPTPSNSIASVIVRFLKTLTEEHRGRTRVLDAGKILTRVAFQPQSHRLNRKEAPAWVRVGRQLFHNRTLRR